MLHRILAAAVLGVAGTALTFSAAASVPESTSPIKIAVNNWSSQIAESHVTGDLLKKLGYNVEYVPSNQQLQFRALRTGDLNVQMEVWQETEQKAFQKALKSGQVLDVGTHDATTREEWWYPEYVEKLCPGLPDWKALNKCADKFSTPASAPKGRFLAGPVEWHMGNEQRIKALGMDFIVVNAGQAASLWAELKAAEQQKKPIVLFNWTPNWVEAVYPGKFVEFPAYSPKCVSDPSWGPNPNMTGDCGSPTDGWLKKAAWKGMTTKWPTALKVIRKINFTRDDLDDMAKAVDVDSMSYDEAAAQWLKNNEKRWKSWMPESAT